MSRKKEVRGWKAFLKYAAQGVHISERIKKMAPSGATPLLAAKIFKCPVSVIRRAIKSQKLNAMRVGKFYLINKESLWGFYAVYYRQRGNRWVLQF